MAIEPLGSIMTMQAQQVRPAVKAEPANMDVNPAPTQSNNIDPTTVSVAAVAETAQQNAENTGNDGGHTGVGETAKQNNEKIRKAVQQMSKNMDHTEAVFGFHDDTNRVTIKIIDKETKEVIKELPPEKTLDMIAKVWELAGLMVDERR